jgi:DNA-binding response OmpR family regulator
MKILVVEDSELLAVLVEEYLSTKGYTVTLRSNCKDALESVIHHSPDAVIVDYTLPDGTGLELLDKFNRQLNLTNIDYILTTGYDTNLLKQEIKKPIYPSIHLLPKPFFMAELLALLNVIEQRAAA